MLTDDDEINRWKAAEALGRLGDPDAVEPLIDALWDDDSRVRLKAAWALGQIGDSRAVSSPQTPIPHGKRGHEGEHQRGD